MATEMVVTPGGYRPSDMVHKMGADLRLRILTGRLQGVDASDKRWPTMVRYPGMGRTRH